MTIFAKVFLVTYLTDKPPQVYKYINAGMFIAALFKKKKLEIT